MKYIIILLMFACCTAIAQTNDGCVNGISTNPASPVNSQTNTTYMQAPEYINSNFDWHERISQNSLAPWSSHNMIYDINNPFTGGANFYISPFDPNGTPWAQGYFPTNYDDMDFFPEDGWELLYMNTGYYPDGSTTAVGLSSVPYVILYNKFRSIIRVFGKTGDYNYQANPIKNVQIKFNFKGNGGNPTAPTDEVSGLFSGQNTYITALDKETEVYQIVALVNHPNSVNQWFHADFHVNYDPCSCWFKSDLQLSFKFISSQSISMVGRAVTLTDQPIANGNVDYSKSFLTNIYTDGNDETGAGAQAVAGSIIYKSMDAMVADYSSKLAALNAYDPNSKKLKRAKVIFDVYTTLKSTAINYVGGQLAEQVLKYAPDIIAKAQGAVGTNFEVKIDTNDTKKSFIKQLGNLSKSLDALVEHKLGLDQTAPPTPTMPTANFTEMSFSGNIKTSSTSNVPSMMNPGTYNDNTVSTGVYGNNEILSTLRYPTYNEALGTFALLETPTVLDFQKNAGLNTYYLSGNTVYYQDQFDYYWTTTISYSYSRSRIRAFKFKNPIKYYFNPATNVNINNTKIEFQLIAKKVSGSNSGSSIVNMTQDDFTTDSEVYSSPAMSLDCFNELVTEFSNQVPVGESNFSFVTEGVANPVYGPQFYTDAYDNHEWLDDQNFTDILAAQAGNMPFDDNAYQFYLKVIIDAEYNSLNHNGIPNTNTIVQTYPLNQETTTNDFSQNIPFNITNVPITETLETTNYTTSSSYNPLEMLYIGGDLTTNNGLYHNLFAGEEVGMNGESSLTASLTSDFNLEIHPVLACTGSFPPVTPSEVYGFCHSQTYKANKLEDPSAQRLANIASTSSNNKFIALPTIDLNATINESSRLNLTSKNENDVAKNFKLIDLQGRVLVTAQYLPSEIDMSNYSIGVYIVEYQTEKGSVRKKIVKSN